MAWAPPAAVHARGVRLALGVLAAISVGEGVSCLALRDSNLQHLAHQVFIGSKWAAITHIVVAAPYIGRVAQTCFERVLGTVLGGMTGLLLFGVGSLLDFIDDAMWLVLSSAAVAYVGAYFAWAWKLDHSAKLFTLTFIIVTFGAQDLPRAEELALFRVGGICFGVVLSLLLSMLIMPSSASLVACEKLRSVLEALVALNRLAWKHVVSPELHPMDPSEQPSCSTEDPMAGADADCEAGLRQPLLPKAARAHLPLRQTLSCASRQAAEPLSEQAMQQASENAVMAVFSGLREMEELLMYTRSEQHSSLCARYWMVLPSCWPLRCCKAGLPERELQKAAEAVRRAARLLWAMLLVYHHGFDATVRSLIGQQYPATLFPQLIAAVQALLQGFVTALDTGEAIKHEQLEAVLLSAGALRGISDYHRRRLVRVFRRHGSTSLSAPAAPSEAAPDPQDDDAAVPDRPSEVGHGRTRPWPTQPVSTARRSARRAGKRVASRSAGERVQEWEPWQGTSPPSLALAWLRPQAEADEARGMHHSLPAPLPPAAAHSRVDSGAPGRSGAAAVTVDGPSPRDRTSSSGGSGGGGSRSAGEAASWGRRHGAPLLDSASSAPSSSVVAQLDAASSSETRDHCVRGGELLRSLASSSELTEPAAADSAAAASSSCGDSSLSPPSLQGPGLLVYRTNSRSLPNLADHAEAGCELHSHRAEQQRPAHPMVALDARRVVKPGRLQPRSPLPPRPPGLSAWKPVREEEAAPQVQKAPLAASAASMPEPGAMQLAWPFNQDSMAEGEAWWREQDAQRAAPRADELESAASGGTPLPSWATNRQRQRGGAAAAGQSCAEGEEEEMIPPRASSAPLMAGTEDGAEQLKLGRIHALASLLSTLTDTGVDLNHPEIRQLLLTQVMMVGSAGPPCSPRHAPQPPRKAAKAKRAIRPQQPQGWDGEPGALRRRWASLSSIPEVISSAPTAATFLAETHEPHGGAQARDARSEAAVAAPGAAVLGMAGAAPHGRGAHLDMATISWHGITQQLNSDVPLPFSRRPEPAVRHLLHSGVPAGGDSQRRPLQPRLGGGAGEDDARQLQEGVQHGSSSALRMASPFEQVSHGHAAMAEELEVGGAEMAANDAPWPVVSAAGTPAGDVLRRLLPRVNTMQLAVFPDTAEGHTGEVKWHTFQFVMEELADALKDLHLAMTSLMAQLPGSCLPMRRS